MSERNRSPLQQPLEPITPSELEGLPDNAIADPYLLRGLVHCGLCGNGLVAMFGLDGVRFYDCPNRRCPLPVQPAEPLEAVAWQRFYALNEAASVGLQPHERQAALRAMLVRVSVHKRPARLSFQWGD